MRLFRSANIRVLCGSAILTVAAVGLGGACAAQPGGDALTQPAGYHGPYLTWAGKTASPAQTEAPAPVTAAASQSEFAAWPAPAAGAPRLRPMAATAYVAPPRFYTPKPSTYVAPPHAYAPVARPKPAAVAAYAAPPAPLVRARRPAQMAVSAPPAAAAQAQPPARVLAQNDTAAAPAPANPLGQTGVHYYSLHREYGLTPDQVQTPKDRPMVLIGPPDNPPTPKPDDASDGADKRGGADGADN